MLSLKNGFLGLGAQVAPCIHRARNPLGIATHACRPFSTNSTFLIDRLKDTARALAPQHPFTHSVTRQNAEGLMQKYLAMSQAFPHIQAGASANLIKRYMEKNHSIPSEVEKTFVAGSFLCWDETGAHYLVGVEGNAALPKILDTEVHFHSSLLRLDLKKIFGREVFPNYCPITKKYLVTLLQKLGSVNTVERVAMMVAFEMHAEQMILALWGSLSEITAIPKEELIYFQIHVGGDDPAEIHHVAITQRLVKELIPQKQENHFVKRFKDLYQLNLDWCQSIAKKE